ncbi:hypothetical protein [Vibrio mediterranei]|uniref:hypothetical protein n=1 Tax=Vibrio mediterranei TaxID=689 RepID=UPI00228333A9|nr:hypothetical protein [Vibrio mediterranei]MCY9855905.1 hypothetical protein [Vibrio mediterranei]
MNNLILVVLLLASPSIHADSIRKRSGISCTTDNDYPLAVRTYVESDQNDYDNSHYDSGYDTNSNGARVGIEFEYSFGGSKSLECDDLFQIALREDRIRVQQLEAKLKLYEKTALTNWEG